MVSFKVLNGTVWSCQTVPTPLSLKTFHSIYLKDFQLPEKNPEDRKEEIGKRQEEIRNSREGKDNIADFIEFKGNFHHKL